MIPPISMAASRDQALNALHDFLPKVPFYGQKRNRVIPGHEDVSRLSGALRHRLRALGSPPRALGRLPRAIGSRPRACDRRPLQSR